MAALLRLKCGVAAMPIHSTKAFEVGDWLKTFSFGARRSSDDDSVVAFLQDLSRAILKHKEARAFPDLMTFGYFCRKASIAKVRAALSDLHNRSGWGTVIHIAPSNIPVNFAFSLLMGMVAGNSNIVRMPTRAFAQMELMVRLFDEVAAQPQHAGFGSETAFVQSDRDSPQLNALIAQAQGLVVWGGDSTVERFRSLPKHPRCVEAYFPNRVSSALLSAQAVLEIEETALLSLCLNFYNDTYLVDQNACSSPNLIFWQGNQSQCEAARNRFWDALDQYLGKTYELDPVARIERSLNVMALADASQGAVQVDSNYEDIWRLTDDTLRTQKLRFGMFLEVDIKDLEQIPPMLRKNEQTLTTFGVDPETVFDTLKSNLSGIDRIVPVGRALDMGLDWDGRQMLSLFSRKTQVG